MTNPNPSEAVYRLVDELLETTIARLIAHATTKATIASLKVYGYIERRISDEDAVKIADAINDLIPKILRADTKAGIVMEDNV